MIQKKHKNDERSHSCQEQRTKLETGLVGTYVVHAAHHTLHRQSKPCTDDTPRYTHLNIALLKPMYLIWLVSELDVKIVQVVLHLA